jgi:hypothetical protein
VAEVLQILELQLEIFPLASWFQAVAAERLVIQTPPLTMVVLVEAWLHQKDHELHRDLTHPVEEHN